LFTSSSTPCHVSTYSLVTDSGGSTVHPDFDDPIVGSDLQFRIKSELTGSLGVYTFYIKTELIGGKVQVNGPYSLELVCGPTTVPELGSNGLEVD
jgi:hypothetical protein